jgi:hypothetical protein
VVSENFWKISATIVHLAHKGIVAKEIMPENSAVRIGRKDTIVARYIGIFTK